MKLKSIIILILIQLQLNAQKISLESNINNIQMLFNLNEFQKAKTELKFLIEEYPNETKLILLEAEILRELNLKELAIKDCKHIISIEPKNYKSYSILGSIYERSGQFDSSLYCFNKSIEMKPDEALTYHDRGLTLYNLQRYDEAKSDFIKTIFYVKTYASAYDNLGRIEAEIGNRIEALKYYNKSLEIKLNEITKTDIRYRSCYNLAQMHLQSGNDSLAKELLLKSVKLNPKYPNAYLSLANLNSSMTNDIESSESCENITSYCNLINGCKTGEIDKYCRLGKDTTIKIYKMISEMENEVSRDPNQSAFFYTSLSKYYLIKSNDYNESFKYCKKAIELDSNNSELMLLIGSKYQDNNLSDDIAISYLLKADKVSDIYIATESKQNVNMRLGELYLKKKKYQVAIKYFLKANELHKTNKASSYLGKCYLSLSEFKLAEVTLTNVLNENPIHLKSIKLLIELGEKIKDQKIISKNRDKLNEIYKSY